MSETILEVQHLGKSFGTHEILRDIDFSVKPKDVTCIIGPSGSGKSTLLRCMNLWRHLHPVKSVIMEQTSWTNT